MLEYTDQHGFSEGWQVASVLPGSDLPFWRLLEKLPAGAYTCDAEGLITYFNHHAEQLWGRAPKLNDPMDRFCGSFKLFLPDGSPLSHDECWMALALKMGKEYNGHEILIERPDGQRLTALAHANPIFDEADCLLGAVNVLVDITERKQIEDAWRSLNAILEQRVAERTAELHQAHDALHREMAERHRMQEALFQREKLAALGTLLANVAHELNNPLAVATIQLDNLQEEVRSDLWTEDLEILRQAVKRCESVVQSFLSLARQKQPTRSTVGLNAVINDALVLLRHALEIDGITGHFHLAEDLPQLWADPHQLQHVVTNLMTNAIHALRQSHGPRHLTLTTAANADQSEVTLEVSDTGPGIPEALHRRIFEPFFTTKPQEMGSGLGLPLCCNIVEAHGGSISLKSQPGHGTTFCVTLPVANPGAQLLESASEPTEPVPGQGETILLIDDEPGVQKALRRVLQRRGHEVTTANNGREGLAALEQRSYEVILCDMRMPDLDGPGFYRELEQRHPHLLSRLIFLTGDALSLEAQTFFDQVDCPRLIKPFNAQKIRQLVQQVLDAR